MQLRKNHAGREEGNDVLPDQVLVSVLELMPKSCVLASAALVNKRWLRVAESKDLWSSKMPPALKCCCAGMGPALSWGKLFFAVYHTNLLANPYLRPPLRLATPSLVPGCWMACPGGNGWAWEEQPDMRETGSDLERPTAGISSWPPPPCPPYYGKAGLPSSARVAGAVASSYRWCELAQVVDLVEELVRRGLSQEAAEVFLDSCPPLSFSVWFAARADCPGECEAKIHLTGGAHIYTSASKGADAGAGAGAGTGAGDNSGGLPVHLANSAARLWGWTTGCVQPGKGSWQRARCVVAGYPAGVRRAVVVLRGRDRRFWTGHWGAKLAAPSLHFLAPDELEAALGGPEAEA